MHPRLDLQSVDQSVEQYFSTGLASNTKKSYRAGQKHYLSFCQQSATVPFPASENILCHFVSILADRGMAHSTIKCICLLSASCTSQGVCQDDKVWLLKLSQVLRGIQTLQPEQLKFVRLPIKTSYTEPHQRIMGCRRG